MKKATMSFSLLVVFLFVFAVSSIAGEGHKHGHASDKSALKSGNAVQTMASIMMHLNHFPSDSEKNTLRKIAANTESAHEKTIANALMMMDHKVTSADKEKLRMVTKDRDVPENTRELANIVQNMNHQVSSKEKMILQDM